MTKKLLIFVILIILCVGVVSHARGKGWKFWGNKETFSIDDGGKDIENLKWNVYKNAEYGYVIKYPENWRYEKETDFTGKENAVNFYPQGMKKTLEYSGNIKIFYYPNPKRLSINAFFNGSQGTGDYTLNEGGEKDYLLNGIKAKIFINIKGGFESKPTNLVIPVEDKFIIISDVYTKYQEDLFFKMIATFKLFDNK